MASKWTWNDGIGSRSRKPACLVVLPTGGSYRFDGTEIPGVIKVLNRDYTKNGKWSNTTYTCASPDGTIAISWMQDWDNGVFWPQESWESAIAWVLEQAPLASAESIEALVRAEWKKAAERFDDNRAALSAMSSPARPLRYLLNSAVITAPGGYEYALLTSEAASEWLKTGEFVSTCGYAETAQVLEAISGVPIPVRRESIKMEVGDESLVFRLAFQPGQARIDPTDKGRLTPEFVAANCEFGLLRRTR